MGGGEAQSRCFTSSAPVKAECDSQSFLQEGFAVRNTYVGGQVVHEFVSSDVVCFESAPADEEGLHSAIMLGDSRRGAFPPNCRFELRDVLENGFEAPNGIFVRQRLLVVRATYAWQMTSCEAQLATDVVHRTREAKYTGALLGVITPHRKSGPQCSGLRLPLELARYIAHLASRS